ncbi:DUF2784 domain-containing protein [Photobacterium lutimaris]|uniref:DUF2784 domain-containing protein n=1 Tax=Photobacterium lutimaris TaxID=388278 RepID=A0A2T3J194_9GAMM|nr:DUF2784 domain-containing protein [Photobacterium lutimaris]PSU34851.1 DUF2784 domain-containing protein [Photobacterium lutimaris]TDR77191.1 uncharacterized protein DUF2784 [Photobacterium lutimaris]
MVYRILADLVVILHLVFIIFALFGGSLVLWRGYMLFVHIPAALWVTVLSFKGWICPLTPLENQLRQAAGGEGYPGGFVEHYIIPVIYPVGIHVGVQVLLGIAAVGINIVIYALVYYRYELRHGRWRE